jgi:hypothetical protein
MVVVTGQAGPLFSRSSGFEVPQPIACGCCVVRERWKLKKVDRVLRDMMEKICTAAIRRT